MFKVRVRDLFSMSGRAMVLAGRVEDGEIRSGTRAVLRTPIASVSVVVDEIERAHTRVPFARAGDDIGVMIRGVDPSSLVGGVERTDGAVPGWRVLDLTLESSDPSTGETSDPIEHDRLNTAATDLLKRSGVTLTVPPLRLGWLSRRRIKKAISLLEQVVAMNPSNWAALWIAGKAHQALRQHQDALSCFAKSHLLNDSHPDVAREAAISAMECGRPELAIEFSRSALNLKPGDSGLLANLGLAHLFAGDPKAARAVIDSSLAADPNDTITRFISTVIDEVVAGKRSCPRRTSDIL